ncbi:MAG TPA: DUF4352 domain-containing protein [Acidimicrobiales bacterium]|nr:DUF4352 domain-containing protein [Acidimicrobiales bacterium]
MTLVKVIDPAQAADQFTTPDAGKRFVGTEFTIVNSGSATFDDDANNDGSVVGSDNQTYTADMSDIAGCTNFNSGQVTLAGGQSATGCVVFQVPTGVNVVNVHFAANMGLGGDTAEWINP